MCPTPSAQRSSVISLLHEGYSVHQIQSRTGLGKSIIGRIKKEIDQNKENSKGGRPSKLSHRDKQTIICQITTERVDNAVQATKYIITIIPNPVNPQTVRNVLKENNFCSVVKKKCPLLKKQHRINCLKFAQYHETWTVEDWKRIL
jgi:transposase